MGSSASTSKTSITSNPKYALLFDCDGVIVLTEELHRLAYNGAFQDFNLKVGDAPVEWNVEYYDVLQNTVGGGKPKMKWHFSRSGWPSSRLGPAPTTAAEQDRLVDELQDKKTEIYKRIVTEVAQARPGVLRLIDEALDRADIAAGICSAATKAGFDQVPQPPPPRAQPPITIITLTLCRHNITLNQTMALCYRNITLNQAAALCDHNITLNPIMAFCYHNITLNQAPRVLASTDRLWLFASDYSF